MITNIGDLFHPDHTYHPHESPQWTISAEELAEVMSLNDSAPFEVLHIHVRLALYIHSPSAAEIDEAQNAPHMWFALIPGEHAMILAHRFGDGRWADRSWQAVLQPASPGFPDPGTDQHIPISVALVDADTGLLRAHRITTWPPPFAIAVRDAITTQLRNGTPAPAGYSELLGWVHRHTTPDALVDTQASIIVRGGSDPLVARSRRPDTQP